MVRVTYRPYEELIVHECSFLRPNDLVKLHSAAVPAGSIAPPLYWVNGVLLIHSFMPTVTAIVKEQLEGRIHWGSIAFAIMPTYQKEIVVRESNVRIPVIDVTSNKIFRDIAEWLKENMVPKEG